MDGFDVKDSRHANHGATGTRGGRDHVYETLFLY